MRPRRPSVRRRLARSVAAGLLAAMALGACIAAGCRRATPPRGATFSAATYNLHRYGLHDRDGDGQRTDPKPEAERDAVAETIVGMRADVLALQEIGHPAVLDGLRADLRRRGLDYPHVELLQREDSETNIALLSRFPIVASRPRRMDAYTVGGTTQPVLRGFIDVDLDVGGGLRLRVFVAHLKSQVFHPLGQTEMRRSEARLLANHVRDALREDPGAWILVAGDLNDGPVSAPLRLLLGGERQPTLHDLRPADAPGGVWTWFGRADDTYARLDYLLASPALRRQVLDAEIRVVREPPAAAASDHRPVIAVFRREVRR